MVLLALGALSGAALLLIAFWVGLALAAALLVVVAVLGALGSRRAAREAADGAQ